MRLTALVSPRMEEDRASRRRPGLVYPRLAPLPAPPLPFRTIARDMCVGVRTDMIVNRLSERPDLLDRVYEVDPNWPEFMRADPVMNAFSGKLRRRFRTCAWRRRTPAAQSSPPAGR